MPDQSDDLVERLTETIIREVQLSRWERRLERAIVDALAAMEEEMLAEVRLVVAAGEIIPGVHEQLLVAEVRKANKKNAAEIAAKMLVGTPELLVAFGGYDFDAQELRLVARVVDMAAQVAGNVTSELHAGTAAGESIDQLRDRVRGVFASSKVRARRIARTEVISAANGANNAHADAVHAAGMELTKTWVATFDRRTRETHAEAHGQTVAFDQPFEVGGYELEYPGDPNGPAEEVINCRCTVTYEPVEDEALPVGSRSGE